MSKHHVDLIMCRKQTGISVGKLCEKCEGRCVICDTYVRPKIEVRICDECNFAKKEKCIICNYPGIYNAYYCKNCTLLEKDRDGCPNIINIGNAKTDYYYEKKRFGFNKL